ncbi:hypothetical protein [Salinicoccus roseus]|uniref:Uncharacterized protein n=1 Tax=Salinicoccus roseus TaxID=45670 RepID=A0A265E797_9STAP|nr:hypothetical protein [Salinicoccus roseus]OZT77128.1 hypothetical protein CFN03_08615 [Salinicoccus roseus]
MRVNIKKTLSTKQRQKNPPWWSKRLEKQERIFERYKNDYMALIKAQINDGGDKMPNKYIKRYIGELLNKRESSEGQLEEADRWLDHWQQSKEAHEKNINEIDEALITLGYKGDEVE